MDKKPFLLFIVLLSLTFATILSGSLFRPVSDASIRLDDFPLRLGDWEGEKEVVLESVLELLSPKEIFSGTYTNSNGIRVHLLFDYFSSEGGFGGPHSPRNCLPGSGWTIAGMKNRSIDVNGRAIPVTRFELRLENAREVMDFWYVTSFGETANDYTFKFYQMLSSLTFRTRDVAFIRFVANEDPESLEALEEFEKLFVGEIYSRLPVSIK